MIEEIYNIGKTIRNLEGEKSLIELWTKDTKAVDKILVIDINDKTKKISKEIEDFYEDAYKDALIYQQGNGHVGAGIKIENYKKEDAKKIKNKKLLSSLSFMEIDKSYLNEVWNIIENEIKKDVNKSYLIIITKNNKRPRELYEYKYDKKIKDTYLISDKNLQKKIKESTCHLCGKLSKTYDTAIYKCFTNDKEIYSNTECYTFCICEDCLYGLLEGRNYINKYLKTIWMGCEVMFLPHEFDINIKNIYEKTNLIANLKHYEFKVFKEIGESNCITDIVFFSDPKSSSQWQIIYEIKNVLPIDFSKVAFLLEKYKNIDNYFSLHKIMNYIYCNDEKLDSKNKDKMKLLEILFKGKKYSRNMFFYKIMNKYDKLHFVIKDIHEIYNFMCECGSLEKSWKLIDEKGELMKYKNREEFFEINKRFFDNDVKKAWFIMGQIYNETMYLTKDWDDEKYNLKKNSFFIRKFDYITFIHIANLCSEKLMKYGNNYFYIKEDLNKAKEYMSNGQSKLNNDEAKYIFFWGVDMRFKKGENQGDVE